MTEKLKPCPFCGGDAEVLPCAVVFESVEYWFVKCSECEARSCADEKWAVVEAWNRRANEEGGRMKPTSEELERKLEITEKKYSDLLDTVAILHRVKEALSDELAETIANIHWAETENDRLRESLEKAEAAKMPDGMTAEDVESLANIAKNFFYDRLTYSKTVIYGKYTSENADFDEFVDEYVYLEGNFEIIGITREWFIGYFLEQLKADYEFAKKDFDQSKAEEEEGGEDD